MRIGSLGLVLSTLLFGCGSAVAPEPDPATLLWAEACIRLSGCEPYSTTADPLFTCHVGRSNFNGTGPAECALAAADCEEAVACFGNGAPPVECPVLASPRCEGDVLIACDPGRQLQTARDCAAEGLECRTNDVGAALCARAGECTEGACEGNTALSCIGGVAVPRDCGRYQCVVSGTLASCGGEGEPCEGRLFRCDGDVAVSCDRGFIRRQQCRPGTCSTSDGAFCRDADECRTHCEGSSVVTCVEGEIERYDCTAWGFTACVEDAASATASCR